MRSRPIAALTLGLLSLAGCHSAFIEATIRNRTPQPISLLQVDYPSASFGQQALAPGADFHYRFKVLGTGTLNLTYTDTAQQEHTAKGPTLREGDEGPVTITIDSTGVHWQLALLPHPN